MCKETKISMTRTPILSYMYACILSIYQHSQATSVLKTMRKKKIEGSEGKPNNKELDQK